MHESGGPEQKREEPRLEDKTAAATTSMLHPDGVASVHPRFTNTNRSSTGKPRILGSFAPGSTGNCLCSIGCVLEGREVGRCSCSCFDVVVLVVLAVRPKCVA